MKKFLFVYIFFAFSCIYPKNTEQSKAPNKPTNRFIIDEIVCKVNGPEREQIFCLSNTKRPGLAGAGQGNLQELVTNELIYQDALHLKLPIEESVVDNYIAAIQQQHNLSMKDVEKIFKASGRTLEEGREELKIMYAVNSMVEMKLKANLIIPEQEVIAFYEANPITEEAKFKLQRGFVQVKADDDISEIEQQLKKFSKTGIGVDVIWSEPVWFAQSDISEKFKFITSMNPNDICDPIPTIGGFELFKLIKKKSETLVPLKKRYRDIVEEKRKPKFEQLLAQYTKELMDSAAIIYFNSSTAA